MLKQRECIYTLNENTEFILIILGLVVWVANKLRYTISGDKNPSRESPATPPPAPAQETKPAPETQD